MINIEELNLKWWQKEDIEDLIEEYPHLLEMSLEEIKKLKTSLFWKSQGLIEEANCIESKANTLQILIDEIEGN